MEVCKKLRREERRYIIGKRERGKEQNLKEIEQLQQTKNIRKYYQRVNESRKTFKPRCAACRDKVGILLVDKQRILERWRQHFGELVNGTENQNQNLESLNCRRIQVQ